MNKPPAMGLQPQENGRLVAVCVKQMEERIKEYEEETKQLKSVHKMVGVTFNDLSHDVQEELEVVAKVASLLECADPSPTSILLSLSSLHNDSSAIECERQRLTRELSKVEKKIFQVESEKENLASQSDDIKLKVDKMRSDRHPQTKTQSHFLKQKGEQYSKQISSLEEQLKISNYSQDIKHSQLLATHECIQSLEKKLKPLKSKLGHFSALPPNLELAQLKIHELKSELDKLEREISKDIDLLDAER